MKWNNLISGYKSQIEIIRAQNAYERLGVDRGVSQNEAKKAYRKKMSLYHPDRTDEFMSAYSEEVSKLLNEAMEQIALDIKNER